MNYIPPLNKSGCLFRALIVSLLTEYRKRATCIPVGIKIPGIKKLGVLIVFLLLVLLLAAPASAQYGWHMNPASGHYYRFTDHLPWLEAENQAVQWGGHLVTINDRNEELWLRGQFGTQEFLWIGFNDIRLEGNWEWSSGESVTYTHWAAGEPNNYCCPGVEEDAAIMNWEGIELINGIWVQHYGDSWNDQSIDWVYRGIVERNTSPNCTFSITPTSQSFDAAGGTGTLTMTATPGCDWVVGNVPDWIIGEDGPDHGSGVAQYFVVTNASTQPRSATIFLSGLAFTIMQAGQTASCSFATNPTEQHFPISGGTGSVAVTAQQGCTWSVSSFADWITITSGSHGSGTGTVNYAVAANSSNASRSGSISIAGQAFSVAQAGGQEITLGASINITVTSSQTTILETSIPEGTPNVFVLLQKDDSWYGTIEFLKDGSSLRKTSGSEDFALQLQTPPAGRYTIQITGSGSGRLSLLASLPKLSISELFVGTIGRNDGYDWAQMDVPAGIGSLQFTVETVGNISYLDVWRGSIGSSEHWSGSQSFNPPIRMNIQNPTAGKYYLRVSDHGILQGSQVRDYSMRVQVAQPLITINNDFVRIEIDPNRACITSLIFKKGSNAELIEKQWGHYLLDLGADATRGNRLNSGWEVESDERDSSYLKLSLKHPSGFANKMAVSWAGDRVDVACEMTVPETVSTYPSFRPGGGWEASRDKWAFPTSSGVQTGSFSYPGGTTRAIFPADGSFQIPSEGWIALWDDQVDEVYGFTFSDGYAAAIWNGAAADPFIRFPVGSSRVGFHVMKGKPSTPYEAIRSISKRPTLSLTKQVNALFAVGGGELSYTLTFSNTGQLNATNVVLEVTLPAGVELVPGSISDGGTYDPVKRKITWMVSSMAFGAQEQYVTFTAKIKEGLIDDTLVNVPARIWCNEQPAATETTFVTTIGTPVITGISPNKGGNTGSLTAIIMGKYLDPHATVKLSKMGHADINATSVDGLIDGTHLTVTFDLSEKAPDLWSVAAKNPAGGSVVLSDGFLIEAGGEPKLSLEVLGLHKIRLLRPATYVLRVRNDGTRNAELVFVLISLPQPLTCLKLSAEGRILWEKGNGSAPHGVVIPSLGPGQTASFEMILLAPETRTIQNTGGKPQANSTMDSGLSFFVSVFLVSAASEFGKSFLRHKWDEYIKDPDLDKYYSDIGYALAAALIEFVGSTDSLAIGTWWEFLGKLVERNLEKLGKKAAARAAGIIWMIITEGEDYAKALAENVRKNPNIKPGDDLRVLAEIILAMDPNDKAGPDGFDPADTPTLERKHFYRLNRPLAYTVRFENLQTATAAVQEMLILDQLDPNLDWSTFAFDNMQIGTHQISLPREAQSIIWDVDLRPEITAIVQVSGTFNPAMGTVQWYLRGVDPYTGLLADFLPPNTDSVAPRGEGWVSYSVKPKANLPTGTVIKNKATIDFEVGVPPAPMDTPEVFNTIDSSPPVSQILPLNGTGCASFEVKWSGTDEGSGIRNYTIYVSDNGAAYQPWLSNSAETHATFAGTAGHTYAFYSIAQDNVGNTEEAPTKADASFTVTGSLTLSAESQTFPSTGGKDSFDVTTGSGCPWTATSNAAWITITSGSSGSGNGTVAYSVAASSGTARTGTISVAGRTFTVKQQSGLVRRKDLIGSWAGQGVYWRNSDTGEWAYVSSYATRVSAADLDGDGVDDILGTWAGSGLWGKYSSTGQWIFLATPPDEIAAGDMNGDGKVDLLGIWAGTIWIRDGATGQWAALSSGADMIDAGDLDSDGKADLIGNWPRNGVWVKHSTTGQWELLASPAEWIATGDLNGDSKVDLLGIWGGTIWSRDTSTGQWTALSYGAVTRAAGDPDGAGKADLIATWPDSGVWVKYSTTQSWERLASVADSISIGRLR